MTITRKTWAIAAFILAIALLGAALSFSTPDGTAGPGASLPANTDEAKIAAAREVLTALNAKDYAKLETLVSKDGLFLNKEPRFDGAGFAIPKESVSEIPKDTVVRMWGYTDGKGDPINLTVTDFMDRYVRTHDYLSAPNVAVNETLGSGNSINMIPTDVEGRTFVAFHFPGFDPKYAGLDWTTIYLIFDTEGGPYKLRGIAKDNWTI